MSLLTDEQKSFYSDMEQTFNTAGWALLIKGWKEEQEALPENVFFNAATIEQVNDARIRYKLLDELIKLPEIIDAQKIDVINDNDGPGEYV